jgi:hypothetical protein
MIIGFCGLIGAGKTTAAKHLIDEHAFTRVRFAGPLKDMMRVLGLSPDHIDGALKELPCELLGGKTPRWAQQSLGTEWGRDLIHPDLWINAWKQRAIKHLRVVADDVRFLNEAAAIRSLGGITVRITRPGTIQQDHPSERQDFPVQYSIDNEGSPEELAVKIDDLVRRIIKPYVRSFAR